jgi:hypothetical protein
MDSITSSSTFDAKSRSLLNGVALVRFPLLHVVLGASLVQFSLLVCSIIANVQSVGRVKDAIACRNK